MNNAPIYFLMVDRFHDGKERISIDNNKKGFGEGEALQKSCGGNIRGVIKNLNYIKNLGCGAIWISPVFENNPESYHGYAIQHFLKIDDRFGTLEDLKELVTKSHDLGLEVYLDIVLNHSGNNWSYKFSDPLYKKGRKFPFGAWRYPDRPMPLELRNINLYSRTGSIVNWDHYPETREGDFFSLKSFEMSDREKASQVLKCMINIYSYWIKETNIDGYRIDSVKHIPPWFINDFSLAMRDVAKEIGKNHFFLFGEVTGDDKLCKEYNGLDAFLDFPLHFLLSKSDNDQAKWSLIKKLFQARQVSPLKYVTFLDNHDQIGMNIKKRIGAYMDESSLLAHLAILFFLPGIPCLYYGTEQAFSGEGIDCEAIRECMFNPVGKQDVIWTKGFYKELEKLSELRKTLICSENLNIFSFLETNRSSVLCFGYIGISVIVIYNSGKKCEKQLEIQLLGLNHRKNLKLCYDNFKDEPMVMFQNNNMTLTLNIEPGRLLIFASIE